MPNPFDDLVSQSTGTIISPETLQLLGKEASASFVGEAVPLNDSIVKLAAAYPHMTSEHVRRVVEFANHETYAALFEKEAGAVKNIEFPYADAEVILAGLKKEATPQVEIPAEHAYHHSVPDFRDRLQDKEAFAILANAFGAPVEKTAEVPEPSVREWQTLQDSMGHLAADASGIEIAYDQACTRFEDAVKQAALTDHSLEEIGTVIHGVLGEKSAMIQGHLADAIRKVQTVDPDIQFTADAEKIASLCGRVIDVSSELAQSAHFLGTVVENRTLLKYAQEALQERFDPVDKVMRGIA